MWNDSIPEHQKRVNCQVSMSIQWSFKKESGKKKKKRKENIRIVEINRGSLASNNGNTGERPSKRGKGKMTILRKLTETFVVKVYWREGVVERVYIKGDRFWTLYSLSTWNLAVISSPPPLLSTTTDVHSLCQGCARNQTPTPKCVP